MTGIRPFKLWIRAARWLTAGLLAVVLVLRLWPLPERARQPLFSETVLSQDDALLKSYLSADGYWRFKADVASLPKHVVDGLICLEDRRFYSHPGVDPLAVLRAGRQNYTAGHVVSGASTLTMQVARLLRPAPRGLLAKAREAVRALHLEAHLSKSEILDLYLSYAPFGGNVEGIEAAARRFFKKSAGSLSSAETAFLFLLPQAPRRWSERDKVDLLALRERNLRRFQACGLISAADREQAAADEIPPWLGQYQILAPHFSDWIRAQNAGRSKVVTTIDANLQHTLEALLKESEARLRSLGILNAGMVVVDNASGEIRAALGNFDPLRNGDAQSFASFLVPRSTGSLMKPFLYGKLLESGELLPESLMEDVPLEIDGRRPQNYNGEFTGLVEARMALAHSLNVPWLRALRDHGVDAFMSFILSSGIKTPQRPGDVGVSMVVGGLEANLLDLTMLYRAVADGGQLLPLSKIRGEARAQQRFQWLHPGAAHLVREALKIRGRPDFAIDPRYLTHSNIRWKTGTSQGNRDAWAVGFDPDFTVGVWLGNLDQNPSPALVGPEVAAPLMFDAFSRLRRRSPNVVGGWFAEKIESVEVCAFSGLPPSPSCPRHKKSEGLAGLAPRVRCPYHQDILVDQESGMRITRECESHGMVPVVRAALDLSPETAEWARNNFPGIELAPAFHPRCTRRPVGQGELKIVSPTETNYILHKAEAPGGRLTIPLKLRSAGGSDWRCFLDGRALAPPERNQAPILRLLPGAHSVLCSDEQGRSDQVTFAVEL